MVRFAASKRLGAARLAWLAGIFLALPAAAQPGAAPTHSTELVLLGTSGGPAITVERSKSANLLIVDGETFLIDCGSGTGRQIVRADAKITDIKSIFITHHHIDHDAGLEPLISTMWFEEGLRGPIAKRTVYGPPATKFLVQTSLQFLSVSERIFRAGIPALPPARGLFFGVDINHDGVVYQADGVRVIAAENAHFHSKSSAPQSGQDRSYSYRFETPAGIVVFTGDTGPSEAVTRLAAGADILVSEIYGGSRTAPLSGVAKDLAFHMANEHLSAEEVGAMAQRAGVKQLVLSHIVGEDAAIPGMLEKIRALYHGPVSVGVDLARYSVGRT